MLPVMTMNAVCEMGLNQKNAIMVDQKKLGVFLNKVVDGYFPEIPYHNDLHGADVMHMVYYFMTKGDLSNSLHLREIDQLSMLIASACHDLGHDGFTNSYHTNAITQRAINSNDISIQEHYHAAQLFKTMQEDDCNFLERLCRTEFIHFRKRVTSLVFATDMSKHATMITSLKQVV